MLSEWLNSSLLPCTPIILKLPFFVGCFSDNVSYISLIVDCFTRQYLGDSFFLFQDKSSALQVILSGEMPILFSKEFNRQGHRERALVMLHQMIEDAHIGKRQFLSGKFLLSCLCANQE